MSPNMRQTLCDVQSQLSFSISFGQGVSQGEVSQAHINAVLAGTELPSKQLLDALCLEDRGNGTYAVKGT